jgi:hypothetical protein
MTAPRGSASPLTVETQKAMARLLVAAKSGPATMAPSLMLCTAIAAARRGPTSLPVESATVRPSGRLWTPIAAVRSTPSRRSFPGGSAAWAGAGELAGTASLPAGSSG